MSQTVKLVGGRYFINGATLSSFHQSGNIFCLLPMNHFALKTSKYAWMALKIYIAKLTLVYVFNWENTFNIWSCHSICIDIFGFSSSFLMERWLFSLQTFFNCETYIQVRVRLRDAPFSLNLNSSLLPGRQDSSKYPSHNSPHKDVHSMKPPTMIFLSILKHNIFPWPSPKNGMSRNWS